MLRLTGGALVGVLLSGCGFRGSGGTTATSAGQAGETTSGTGTWGARGVVFNTASQDVTLFDTASNEVTGSQPTDAVVRWLSNEQHYWDGESIWTYDFPENELRAVAIDPRTFEVIKQVPVDGAGPGHSFVLTPDNSRGFVNSAGSDFLAVVDPTAGEVIERVEMGAFP
jgi:DNA-binding beta-propeller fold protein YncE